VGISRWYCGRLVFGCRNAAVGRNTKRNQTIIASRIDFHLADNQLSTFLHDFSDCVEVIAIHRSDKIHFDFRGRERDLPNDGCRGEVAGGVRNQGNQAAMHNAESLHEIFLKREFYFANTFLKDFEFLADEA